MILVDEVSRDRKSPRSEINNKLPDLCPCNVSTFSADLRESNQPFLTSQSSSTFKSPKEFADSVDKTSRERILGIQ